MKIYHLSDNQCTRDRFAEWLRAVDRLLVNMIGLDSGSIEDWDWYGSFREGLRPQDAVTDWRGDVLHDYGIDC